MVRVKSKSFYKDWSFFESEFEDLKEFSAWF